MSVRKAHNSGRNHLRNVVEWYQQIGHEAAQSVIDSITQSYAAEGQASQNPMLQAPGGLGAFGAPPPFGFPGGMPPPMGFAGAPGGSTNPSPDDVNPNGPQDNPNLQEPVNGPMPPFPPGNMPFPPPFPPSAGFPTAGNPIPGMPPFPIPGQPGMLPPGGLPPNFPFPPPMHGQMNPTNGPPGFAPPSGQAHNPGPPGGR